MPAWKSTISNDVIRVTSLLLLYVACCTLKDQIRGRCFESVGMWSAAQIVWPRLVAVSTYGAILAQRTWTSHDVHGFMTFMASARSCAIVYLTDFRRLAWCPIRLPTTQRCTPTTYLCYRSSSFASSVADPVPHRTRYRTAWKTRLSAQILPNNIWNVSAWNLHHTDSCSALEVLYRH